jgi:hypothetical protein
MKDFFNKALAWIKDNMIIAICLLIGIVILFFPKLLRGITGTRRIRHRRSIVALPYRRRRLPRSVGLRRARKQYTKGGKAKKPWQIAGSEAARRHMRKIRAMR